MWPLRAVDQMAERRLDRVDGAEPVHARHRLDALDVLRQERPVVGDAGVGDHEVEPARLARRTARRRPRPAPGRRRRPAARPRAGRARAPAPQSAERASSADGGSARGQRPRQLEPDPARGAGDERPGRRVDAHRAGGYAQSHVARSRHRRRRGVPADHLLAPGGRPADDGGERRPRHAALGADRARDDRPPRARRLHHARRRQGAAVHGQRARARRGHRHAGTG